MCFVWRKYLHINLHKQHNFCQPFLGWDWYIPGELGQYYDILMPRLIASPLHKHAAMPLSMKEKQVFVR